MTPEEIIAAIKVFDWQLAVGLAVAALYLPIGTWLLLKRPPHADRDDPQPALEWYRRWRFPLVGVTFLLLGAWAAGGATEIATGIRGFILLLVLTYLFLRGVGFVRWWYKGMPVPGQVYVIKGVGEVEVTAAVSEAFNLDHTVTYQDGAGNQRTVNMLQFRLQTRGTLQGEREVAGVEIERTSP